MSKEYVADCGIFVRNGQKVVLLYPSKTIPDTITGKKFRTFGRALRKAKKMGFRTFESDDGVVVKITKRQIKLANRRV